MMYADLPALYWDSCLCDPPDISAWLLLFFFLCFFFFRAVPSLSLSLF